ncbi:acyltransferase family protein [Phnomibacter ginsenosidimutans]|uniref:DUF5009 domain-containing protein n=1 Tax=Phnomibacter ginsenosidimutans TaxID=2676868 RepID=A0A6I6G7G0_9BACT|nr:DUF5009 domain-containing protein [Phnomibacter ginsenosidimutans]QGW27423.1 DUF5009 domain-containing protein [Phnomibacter ginsenosidimutans]
MRLTSLDYFRGMTIFFMILVSLPGNYYTTHPALLHASWHGFTPTDLVFPSFLFASGNAIALTVGKYNLPNHLLVMKVIKRAIIIFTLGILLYWFPFIDFLAKELRFFPVSDIRFLGVLQRIAIVYALVSIMSIYISTRGIAIIALLILPVYWLLLYQLPHGIDPLSIKDNAVLFIDKRIIGDAHLYKGEGFPFDPEGLLSTIPSLVNAMAGFITARFIKARGISALSVLQLMVAGVMMIAVAYIWSYSLPFNKKIWTKLLCLVHIRVRCCNHFLHNAAN